MYLNFGNSLVWMDGLVWQKSSQWEKKEIEFKNASIWLTKSEEKDMPISWTICKF